MSKVAKVITIQIVRPDLSGLTESERRAYIAELALSVAEQIVKQEDIRLMHENIVYWQNKFLEWELEERINEVKYGRLIQPDQSTE